ncbi:MAG: malto-oligosyltrehalose trehalohydrolase [Deltaproteobacteria bacterium]|nr:malto-oligosyltrehalose trehalohydrolase [Deltaproteobacteria bacterium]
MRIGPNYLGDGICEFTVWGPLVKRMKVRIKAPGMQRDLPMEMDGRGYWRVSVRGLPPGTPYVLCLDGRERPDPSSHSQPDGIESPSRITDHSFGWDDPGWKGIKPSGMVIYEVHTGAFTPEGTFEAIIPRLEAIKDLGVNAIELMPVAQFPGERNWGYDGVFPFAPQNTYGGPAGLKRLVNACHGQGISVILDVVYNHLGPLGNYLSEFGPYFTDRYKTPWGMAVNFDGPYSDEVRNFFIENALHWYKNYHIDGLRLDAIHAIYDFSAKPFLALLKERAEEFSREEGRFFYLMAESDLNDPRAIADRESHGLGLDALWCDDFHHSVHALLTGERDGYYVDFGAPGQMAQALKGGYVYTGQYSVYRKRSFGAKPAGAASRFIVFSQNHDQTGNRMLGERLSSLVTFEALKLAAGLVMLSPHVPLIFMGEEYAEVSPFLYFMDFPDRVLSESIKNGRKEEFREFSWKGEPPDPQSPDTLLKSKINWDRRSEGINRAMLGFYKRLISMRKTLPALTALNKRIEVSVADGDILFLRRWGGGGEVFAAFNCGKEDGEACLPEGVWEKALDSSDGEWAGPGPLAAPALNGPGPVKLRALSLAVYVKGASKN